AAIRQVQPRGPYHLGGWSAGGVIALEMAQQLVGQGEQVGLLTLLDTTVPLSRARLSSADPIDHSGREDGLDGSLEELARLGPDELLPYLWDHALKLGLIDPGPPLELARQVLDDLKRLFHLHVRLTDGYLFRPYPGRITLFRPSEVPFAVEAPPDRGWGKW